MKKTLTKFTSSVGIITGLTLGAFALSALANYTSPTFAPPDCPANEPACNAPINVGQSLQTKNGPFGVNETSMTVDSVSGTRVADFEVAGKTLLQGSAAIGGTLLVNGVTKTIGGLVIQTCASGSCPGDGSNPVETGQMWLVK
ncbi:MAG: hypothetical protein M1459_01800 [Patescibacteria group bacterium]|nr:hypothetical protein [Patescibacteria group bacterium]